MRFTATMAIAGGIWISVLWLFGPLLGLPAILDNSSLYFTFYFTTAISGVLIHVCVTYLQRRWSGKH